VGRKTCGQVEGAANHRSFCYCKNVDANWGSRLFEVDVPVEVEARDVPNDIVTDGGNNASHSVCTDLVSAAKSVTDITDIDHGKQ